MPESFKSLINQKYLQLPINFYFSLKQNKLEKISHNEIIIKKYINEIKKKKEEFNEY